MVDKIKGLGVMADEVNKFKYRFTKINFQTVNYVAEIYQKL